ncbi:MAG: thioredoxin-like protein [Monoraphidium minutum]|nr:MAG: thioredoxin-like protein [Monoraphidium minutum]
MMHSSAGRRGGAQRAPPSPHASSEVRCCLVIDARVLRNPKRKISSRASPRSEMQRLGQQAVALALRQRAGWAPAAAWQQGRGFAIGADTGSETHDDFKPKYKAEPVADVADQIRKDIASNAVFIYMKGSPDAPQCGFSNMACRILDAYGLKYGSSNVLADAGIREGVKKFTDWPTIPQVFVKGEFIGGSDVLMEMHNSGEMAKLVESLGGGGGAGGKL